MANKYGHIIFSLPTKKVKNDERQASAEDSRDSTRHSRKGTLENGVVALTNKQVEAYQKSTSDQVSKLSKKLRNVQLTTIGLPLKSISPTNLEIESESETDAESIRARTSGAVSPSHSRFSKSYHTDPTSPKSQQASLAAPLYNHRIILTTYPGQHGVSPIPLTWGSSDPKIRGPVVSSRHPSSIKLRNSVGAHGGSYSVYRALAIAMGELQPDHKPDLLNTEPVIQIGPHPSWNEPHTIVSIDPFGKKIFHDM